MQTHKLAFCNYVYFHANTNAHFRKQRVLKHIQMPWGLGVYDQFFKNETAPSTDARAVTKHHAGPQPPRSISTARASHAIVVTLRPTAPAVGDRGERALPQGGAPEVGLSLNEVFVPLNARV